MKKAAKILLTGCFILTEWLLMNGCGSGPEVIKPETEKKPASPLNVEKINDSMVETRWYDILDLTIPIMDLPGPNIVTNQIEGRTEDSSTAHQISGEQLIELIRNKVGKTEGQWDTPFSIEFQESNGVLVVKHLPTVHQQITELLKEIRSEMDVVVTNDILFLEVSENVRENISKLYSAKVLTTTAEATLRYSILNNPAVSMILQAVQKNPDSNKILTTSKLTCLNNQKSHLAVLKQEETTNPVSDVVTTGTVLDIHPFISTDKKHITLHLKLQRAETDASKLVIPNFSVVVPDGGTILISCHPTEQAKKMTGLEKKVFVMIIRPEIIAMSEW
ncbi:MAG: hypothetical protein AAB019_08525 [Planctomycetota bacterium]|mgnify:CR=1 FL=1